MSTDSSKAPEPPFRIHLVRHGEVDPAWKGRIYGGMDVPLAPEGRQRFVELAPCVVGHAIQAVYASGLSRAIHGASCFAQALSMELEQDPRWNEIDRGHWSGLAIETIEDRWPGALAEYKAAPGSYAGHGGETFAALQERVWPALMELAERHVGQEILVVCHAQVIRVLLAHLLAIPDKESLSLMLSHGGISTLDRFADGHWVVQSINAETLRSASWGTRYKKP